MPLAAIITIIGAVLTVLVLAAYLISVARILGRVNAKLHGVTAGLRSVPDKTAPIGSIVGQINKDLAGADDALRAVLAK
ncbi:MAG: hypothetical protein M3300_00705 [Actinomycetota bacterium]|jgi:hypothetical protein|nr:hypothetical protein [Actinomycetota bacterium]